VNVYDYLLGHAMPERLAVLSRSERVTYAELIGQAEEVARNLRLLGIGKGASVGVLGENSAFWIASYLGILKLGAVAVPFPARLSGEKLSVHMERMRCVAICTDSRRARQLDAQLSGRCALVTPTGPVPGAQGAQGAQGAEPRAPARAGGAEMAIATIEERTDLAGRPGRERYQDGPIAADAEAAGDRAECAAGAQGMAGTGAPLCRDLRAAHARPVR